MVECGVGRVSVVVVYELLMYSDCSDVVDGLPGCCVVVQGLQCSMIAMVL